MSSEPATQSELTDASRLTSRQACGRWFAPVLSLVYLTLILIQLTHHVMWRDELRPWQMISQCSSAGEMIKAMRYDAVPPLWNLIVFALTRFTSNPLAMQLTHAGIATAVVFVVAQFGPFSRGFKVLFALGYFPLFEYGVLTRNYSLVFLLLMISCAILAKPRVNLLALSVVLFLLTQTSIWGAGFAALMFAVGIATAIGGSKERSPRAWEVVVAALVVLVGGLICLATIRPGPGPAFVPEFTSYSEVGRLSLPLQSVTKGLLPIPLPNLHFWNSNALDDFPLLQVGVGVALLILIGAALWRRWIAFTLYVCGATGLLGFSLIFPGWVRHSGHFFMLVIAGIWLAQRNGDLEPWKQRSIVALLLVQTLAGIAAAIAGMILPFSMSRHVSDFIRTHFDLDQVIIAGVPDFCTAPISQWLDRSMYFPEMRRFARVNSQKDTDRPGTNPEFMITQFYDMMKKENKPILLIADARFYLVEQDTALAVPGSEDQHAVQVRVLPSFSGGIVETEDSRLYLISIAR